MLGISTSQPRWRGALRLHLSLHFLKREEGDSAAKAIRVERA